MASALSSAEIFELNANALQFKKWNENEPEVDFVSHAKKCVLYAIDKELTERQRQFFTLYFVEGKSMEHIANEMGVNKSTVSRTVTSAKKKIARVLVYSAPHLINAKLQERNRRT